jgi:prolyl-tRNA synthetase
LRCREFSMKDAYSFDVSEAAARDSYAAMREAYTRIFDRLGLDYRLVSADSGSMGGSMSEEFQVLVQSGEDVLAACRACKYAANLEVASSPAPVEPDRTRVPDPEKVPTPGARTIAEVSAFLGAAPDRFLKSLVFMVQSDPVLVVLRGDHELNEVKLQRALGTDAVRMAEPEEVRAATGADVGFAGPVGFRGRIVIDQDAAAVTDAITGANETDHHLKHVTRGRDFTGEVRDLRSAVAGDPCPRCASPLELFRGIEAGHIFILGTHYSAKMGAFFLDESGESRPLVMGCYGIGVSRLVATAVEQHHDDDGICWPVAIAPYQVHIVQIGEGPEVSTAVADVERRLAARGVEVLVDDRPERPGVKFKDADLIGIPYRINIGERGLKNGTVELKPRTEKNPRNAESLPLADVADVVARLVQEALSP